MGLRCVLVGENRVIQCFAENCTRYAKLPSEAKEKIRNSRKGESYISSRRVDDTGARRPEIPNLVRE